jgi:mediator of RNA polymerase II transcription subunit 12
LHGLPSYVLNLRQTLLSTLAVPVDHEPATIIATKVRLADQIPSFFFDDIPPPSTVLECDSALLSQMVKFDVARWIRQTLISRLQLRIRPSLSTNDSDQHMSDLSEDCPAVITLAQFQSIRGILEGYGNFSILADILNILSNEVQGSILTAIADTVNFHFAVFDAIGAAADLFQNLCNQLGDLSGQDVVEQAFVESLIDLGRRLPGATQDLQKLRKKFSTYGPRSLAAACSPISDNMVEAVQTAEPTFADDMDQMLAGGTSMDKQTLTRVFETIMAHLEKSMQEPEPSVVRTTQLLARLRGFDITEFDFLFQNWLRGWLQSEGRPKLLIVLPPIICSKVVSFKVVLNAIAEKLRGDDLQDQCIGLALEALELMTQAGSELMPIVDYRAYRICFQLHRLVRTDSSSITTILHVINGACTAADFSIRSWAQSQLSSLPVRDLIKEVILQRAEITRNDHSSLCYPVDAQRGIASLLHTDDQDTVSGWDTRTRISRLLNNVSVFNIPLAQIELKMVLELAAQRSEDATTALSEILIEQVLVSTKANADLLTCLVSELLIGQATSVRERAEREFLSKILDENASKPERSKLYSLASVIEAAASNIPDGATTRFVEQVSDLLNQIAASPPLADDHIASAGSGNVLPPVELLLRLLIIHQTTIQHPKFPQNALFRLLISLSLLLNPSSSDPPLQHQVLDVLTLVSDSLSDHTRTRCIHTLRDLNRTKDLRLQFVFGYDETVENEWLQLVTKFSSAAEGAATTNTQFYQLRRWEMMQDATPLATENDTSLSLSLFGARKSVL